MKKKIDTAERKRNFSIIGFLRDQQSASPGKGPSPDRETLWPKGTKICFVCGVLLQIGRVKYAHSFKTEDGPVCESCVKTDYPEVLKQK
jgi:hypothetical protein